MAVFYVVLLIHLIINASLVSKTQGAVHFTVVPPSTLFVFVGETAKLLWDYTVDDKIGEFDIFSPRWVFYADDGSAFVIAQENIFKREWYINRYTCPARLLNPVRVSKESNATLVIHNVTLADSGTYGCVLVLAKRSPIASKVNLVVTTYPIITLNLSSSSITKNASRAFFINCFAVGTPTPTVTWQTVGGKVIDQGVGKATINITRDDSEIYKCCANNNPSKPAVCKITLISAQYKQEINVGKIILRCNASGVPASQSTRYDTSDGKISKALRHVKPGSFLELVATDEDRYGLHQCKAERFHGYDNHFINVTQAALTSKPKDATPISPTNIFFSTRVHQGLTFATGHLIVTSISVTGNIILAIFVYSMVKRTGLKTLWKRTDSQRGLQQEVFAVTTDSLEMGTHETSVSETPNEPPDPIPSYYSNNVDVSRKTESTVGAERTQNENHEEQRFQSGSRHVYQRLGDGSSKEHEYQSLHRKTEEGQASKSPCLKEQGDSTRDVNYQQGAAEYQELHLYSSLE